MKILQKYYTYCYYTQMGYNSFVYRRKLWNQFQSINAMTKQLRLSFSFTEV